MFLSLRLDWLSVSLAPVVSVRVGLDCSFRDLHRSGCWDNVGGGHIACSRSRSMARDAARVEMCSGGSAKYCARCWCWHFLACSSVRNEDLVTRLCFAIVRGESVSTGAIAMFTAAQTVGCDTWLVLPLRRRSTCPPCAWRSTHAVIFNVPATHVTFQAWSTWRRSGSKRSMLATSVTHVCKDVYSRFGLDAEASRTERNMAFSCAKKLQALGGEVTFLTE